MAKPRVRKGIDPCMGDIGFRSLLNTYAALARLIRVAGLILGFRFASP